MNIEKHLILINDEDKTESVSHCVYENGKWQVNFGKDKIYSYHSSKVKCINNPDLRYPDATNVYYNDQLLSGIEKILIFDNYIRICFISGYKKIYNGNDIRFEENCLNNPNTANCFEYLKQLAEIVSISSDDNSSFLSNQYKKISQVNSDSVLAKYLNPTKLNSRLSGYLPIFPFGFNLSQKEATEKALENQVSVIEGPPGTGKTQTILNIIANAVINKKTVAIVSNNNAATANVLEKLEKYGLDFIAAYLGKNENKKEFFANQSNIYPDMTSWMINTQEYTMTRKKIDTSGKQLEEMLKIKNENAILKQKLAVLMVEKEYFNQYYDKTNKGILPYKSFCKHNSKTVMKLWLEYQLLMEKCTAITLIDKIKNLFKYGIISFSFYKNSNEEIIALFQKLYYELKEKELNEEIKRLEELLENYHFEVAIKKYSENSMKLLKATLAKRFFKNKERKIFTDDVLWKNIDSFNKEYPIILSTTHSLRSCISSDYLFDYIIMDEASQVDVVAGSLALSCAKNAVIVGDLKQLPNVVSSSIYKDVNRIFEKYRLDRAYNYADNSMLSSITGLFNDVPRSLLREHYRCHPKIIGFCNQKFYDNELIILTEEDDRKNPLVAYKTVKGNHARGNYNQRQIDVILQEVIPDQTDNNKKQTIGVISPYRLQTEKVKESIGTLNIEVDTVHKYQGREKDIVILTTVVNEINSFVDNPNLINVAVSRAVDKLVVIISEAEKKAGSNIGDLVRYIEYNNFEIINSTIYSVFDLLYHDYSDCLNELMKKNVSFYESENLMYIVIEQVLNLPEFNFLDCVLHQPLKMLIRNPEKLNKTEYDFTMNVLTHTDFLIFNKSDKSPVLAVEVDGYEFHANNPKQLERDEMKDNILKKYDIPILRIKTNESGEETKLYNKLIEILKVNEQN